MARTTTCCLTVCDKSGGAVFELTPDNLEVRTHINGVCCCTNHFRTEKLSKGQPSATGTRSCRRAAGEGRPETGRVRRVRPARQGRTGQVDASEYGVRAVRAGAAPGLRPGPSTKLKPVKLELGKLFDEK